MFLTLGPESLTRELFDLMLHPRDQTLLFVEKQLLFADQAKGIGQGFWGVHFRLGSYVYCIRTYREMLAQSDTIDGRDHATG